MIAEARVTPPMASVGKIFGAIIGAKRLVGAVGKNGQVTEYGKYDYRRFDDVLDAVVPLLNEFGILVVATVMGREERQDGKKHFVTMTMGYRLYAEDGSFIEGSQVGEAFDVGDKAATKAQTVALRIFYCTTFNIPYNEMKDSESGEQHQFQDQSKSTYRRLIDKLINMQDVKNLNGYLGMAIKCFRETQENGDRLTAEELKRSKEEFTSAARRLRFSEKVVSEIASRIDSALSGDRVSSETASLGAVEPVRFREIMLDFGTAENTERRERCVLTLLQSYRTGAIDPEELSEVIAKYCPEDESNGGACFLLGILYNAGTASEVSGISASIQQAIQTKQIGKDVGQALSQFAQHRIEKIGDDNGNA